MIRRSFRFGLTLGLLGGLAFALVKMFGARPEPQTLPTPSPTAPWPRLQADPTVPAPATTSLVPDPDAPERTTPPASEATTAPPTRPAPAPAASAKPRAPKAAAPKPPPAKATPPTAAAKPPTTAKAATKKKPLVAPWVEPTGGVCPTSHPVKGKLSSKIFHLPGMLNYGRTTPDRCYRDAQAAEADGLRPSKR